MTTKDHWDQIEQMRKIIWDNEHLGAPSKIANALWDAGYRRVEGGVA